MVDDYITCLTRVMGALLLGAGIIVTAVGGMEGAIGVIVVGVIGLSLGSYLLAMGFVRHRPR
jgi:hypothetical protein